jgi:predicted MPP superfamily phosphohydrolase
MAKQKRFSVLILLSVLIACLLSTIIYTIIDNHRFKIVEVTIALDRLPDSFEGFRILQISDLHGAYFGQNQVKILDAINKLNYDMIAFTGDMNNNHSTGDSMQSSQAVLDLVKGIQNKENMFWVDGNWGPFTINTICDIYSGTLTPIGKVLQESSVILLTQPVPLNRNGDQIWITPTLSKSMFSCYQNSLSSHPVEIKTIEQIALEQAVTAYNKINDNGEMKLLLRHYPFPTNLKDSQIEAFRHLDYDLILAGHYHGGQIRLPVIGALYIPSDSTGINNSGLFPSPEDVKGISYFGSTPQYVSAGLGSSKILPLLNFRLFNTPELNLITLTKSK